MNEHPVESLPAFVLGALDADESLRIAEHLRSCDVCRIEAEEFRAAVALLPYATLPQQPPAHIKHQLLARVGAHRPHLSPGQNGIASQPLLVPPRSQWARLAAVAALVLAVVLGGLAAETNRQLGVVSASLAQNRQASAALQATMVAQQAQLTALTQAAEQATVFISAPATVGQPLVAQQPGAVGKMYMQRGHNRVVIALHGLPPLASGQTYQFWFATNQHQVPSRTFAVDDHGVATVVIDAPQTIDGYAQVMITVEQAGGSQIPSQDVVLSAEL